VSDWSDTYEVEWLTHLGKKLKLTVQDRIYGHAGLHNKINRVLLDCKIIEGSELTGDEKAILLLAVNLGK
jgi:hypothetical protein